MQCSGGPRRQQHILLLRTIEQAGSLAMLSLSSKSRLLLLRQQYLMLSQWPLLLAKRQRLLATRAQALVPCGPLPVLPTRQQVPLPHAQQLTC